MNDMNTFERRLAAELEHIAGRRRAVDARTVRESAQARAARTWPVPPDRLLERLRERTASRSPLLRAAQLVAAAVVLTIFGGLLLAGLMGSPDDAAPAAVTAPPSPSVIATLPAGAVTEPVAPGIVRLLDDGAGHGHREWKGDELVELGGLHLGPDGQTWIVTTAEGSAWYAWQVGVPGRHEPSASGFPSGSWWGPPILASTPDGTLWAGGNHLASFDGEAWTRHDPRGPSGDPNYDSKFPRAISLQPDGTLWAAWWFDIGRLGPGGWDITGSFDPLDEPGSDAPCDYPFTDFTRRIVTLVDGSLVAGGPGCLARFDGETWRALPSPDTASSAMADEIRTGGSGVLWAHINTADFDGVSEDYLARFEGADWHVFPVSDDVNRLRTVDSSTVDPKWRVDREGTVWLLADRVAADADPDERRLWSFDGDAWRLRAREIEWFTIDRHGTVWASGPNGTSYLDSETWRRYPRVTGLFALDVADDGTVWALGDEHSIYAIDPDAPTVDGGRADFPFLESGE